MILIFHKFHNSNKNKFRSAVFARCLLIFHLLKINVNVCSCGDNNNCRGADPVTNIQLAAFCHDEAKSNKGAHDAAFRGAHDSLSSCDIYGRFKCKRGDFFTMLNILSENMRRGQKICFQPQSKGITFIALSLSSF